MSKILVVDDHEQNRYLLQTILATSGHEALEAANGSEALELARRVRPDLIISDILMPQIDGFALCRECKRDEELRDIPFIFYTATYTDPRDRDLAMRLGAARFIVKPVENEEFIAIVRQVLREHAAGQLTAPPPPLEEEVYRLYSETLVRKLEDKMLQLEEANRALELEIAERKQAEQALRESEKRLQEAQALGRIGNWEFDVDSQSITWSDQVYRLYERDPALGPPTVGEEAAYYAPEQAERLH
ncbi:MAG: response regulator, partial [Anaerolineae bacterium]|nr:response regulator [Anaerolineae bacterium]